MDIKSVTFQHFLGPIGGIVAISFATGAASGYAFALKIMKKRIEFLEKQIEESEKRHEALLKKTCKRYDSELETMRQLVSEYMKQTQELQKMLLNKK